MTILVWCVLCLIWGTTWLFIKVGLRDVPPLTFSSLRFSLAILIIGAVILGKRIPLPNTRDQWKLLVVTGFLQFTVNYSLVFWSEMYITSGLAAVLQAMIPVFGLLLAWIYIPEEKLTVLKTVALIVGIIGVGVIFREQLFINDFWAFAGSVAIVAGAYAAAHASILTKARGSDMHPATLVFGQMICGVPPVILIAAVKEGNPFELDFTVTAVFSILYLTVFGTIAAFWLYYWLLSKIESTKAMTIALVTPLVAVLFGSIFLGERLPVQTFIGGLLILASVSLIVFRSRIRLI